MANNQCTLCGLPIVASGRYKRTYCGEKCKQADRNRKLREATLAKASSLCCIDCGEPIEYKGTRYPKRCPEHTKLHAAEVKRAHNLEYAKRRADRLEAEGVTCTEADCERVQHSRAMCRMHYKRWARANGLLRSPSDAWGPKRKAQWRAKQARRKGSPRVETIYYDSIHRRDNWTCGVCGKPVDKTLAWPDPMSASVDHRIPLSKGGTHTRDNVQCTHLVCNMRKGSKIPQSTLGEGR